LFGKDGKIYTVDENDAVIELGAGGGGLNYIQNPTAESDVTTGVSDGAQASVAAETSNNLVGTQSFELTFTGASTGWVHWALDTIDAAYEAGAMLSAQAIMQFETNAGAEVHRVGVYNTTDSEWVTTDTAPNANTTEIFHYKDYFSPVNGKTYVFRAECTTYSAGSVLIVDSVSVGPDQIFSGPNIGKWKQYTPTFTNFTVTTAGADHKFFYREVGDCIEIKGACNIDAVSGTMEMTIPDGYTANTDYLEGDDGTSTSWTKLGEAMASQSFHYDGTVVMASSSLTNFYFAGDDGANLWNATIPITWATNNNLAIRNVLVPVNELSATTNYINETNIGSNARFAVEGLDSLFTVASGGWREIDTWNSTYDLEGGGSFDGTSYTIPADGWYDVSALARYNTPITASDCVIGIYKNTSTQISLFQKETDAGTDYDPSLSASYKGKFVAGDTVSVKMYQNSGGDEDIQTGVPVCIFSVIRIANVSAGQAFGFGTATADRAGLVSREQTETVAADSGYTGGNVVCQRVGSAVTITCDQALTHASASSVTSSSGLIPADYRPSDDIYQVYLCNATDIYLIGILANGTVTTVYRDYSGTLAAKTSTSTTPSVSYVVT